LHAADRNAVQTISRLNRCHPDKQGVVVVDYAGTQGANADAAAIRWIAG
jgi:type I site-specific restriction-modification system R (restriction) subunit